MWQVGRIVGGVVWESGMWLRVGSRLLAASTGLFYYHCSPSLVCRKASAVLHSLPRDKYIDVCTNSGKSYFSLHNQYYSVCIPGSGTLYQP